MALRVHTKLVKVGLQPGPPRRVCRRVALGRYVAEKVDVVGPVRGRCDGAKFGLQCIQRQHGAGQGAQSARVAHRNRQSTALHAGHGGLNEGELETQLF